MIDVMSNPTRDAAPAAESQPPRRPLRVLHVLGSLDRGGVETWLMSVLRRLDPRRVRFDFVSHFGHEAVYDAEARALGARVFRRTDYRNMPRYMRRLRDLIAAEGPYDVVHSHVHDFSGAVVRAAVKAGVSARFAHSHNDTAAVDAAAGLPRRLYVRWMRRWINRHATRLVACSVPAGAALFGPDWQADPRAVHLPYGIDLHPFDVTPHRAALAAALGLPVSAKVIAHVGRFDPQKNHRRLLQMAAVVLKEDPEARLVLVGEGPLRRESEQYAGSLGIRDRVVFAGVRGDVPDLMAGLFDVMLFPSLFEGLGLVVVEAQAAGLPVVMSDTVPDEAVKMNGRVDRLPLSEPDEAWARAVAGWLARRQEPRPAYAERLASLKGFDVVQSVARLEALYFAAVAAH